ncbi:MAG: hypothetical protein E2O92_01620 [Alphaproteobacteria bacterium]|nr:MAG: hypothetical protein E2O92_01620 [Alphaproteobacteria bacterium]
MLIVWRFVIRIIFCNFLNLIAKLEERPIGENVAGIDTLKKVRQLERELHAVDTLQALAVYTRELGSLISKKTRFVVLVINHGERRVSAKQYIGRDLEKATNYYAEMEAKALVLGGLDVVLVSAISVQNLIRAYPNYFADSSVFQGLLTKVLESE